jgi:hypothetical protein
VPQRPQELGTPEQAGASPAFPSIFEAKTENFFSSRVEPQCGQGVPSQFVERTNSSLSLPHRPQ